MTQSTLRTAGRRIACGSVTGNTARGSRVISSVRKTPVAGPVNVLHIASASTSGKQVAEFAVGAETAGGTGNIKGVPPESVQRLIGAVSPSGDFNDIDREIERYREMERAGLTDLALRVFNDPFDALQAISKRVILHFS